MSRAEGYHLPEKSVKPSNLVRDTAPSYLEALAHCSIRLSVAWLGLAGRTEVGQAGSRDPEACLIRYHSSLLYCEV